MTTKTTYYAIVTFGSPTIGRVKSYYRSLDVARRDMAQLGGGSMTTARILACPTVQDAKRADISDRWPVVAQR